MKGSLYLIPTPIDGESSLGEENLNLLKKACENKERSLFIVEDPKPARRAWIRFGLDRSFIDDFIYFNEQTHKEILESIVSDISQGKNAYLLSDCGLPAFCDPGTDLVDACHKKGIRVTAGKFNNSVVLALALSGFSHERFEFFGFLPRKSPEREDELKRFVQSKKTSILMDTPYRLSKVLDELLISEKTNGISRTYLIACDLNKTTELVFRGGISSVRQKLQNLGKKEFVLVSAWPRSI